MCFMYCKPFNLTSGKAQQYQGSASSCVGSLTTSVRGADRRSGTALNVPAVESGNDIHSTTYALVRVKNGMREMWRAPRMVMKT